MSARTGVASNEEHPRVRWWNAAATPAALIPTLWWLGLMLTPAVLAFALRWNWAATFGALLPGIAVGTVLRVRAARARGGHRDRDLPRIVRLGRVVLIVGCCALASVLSQATPEHYLGLWLTGSLAVFDVAERALLALATR